MSASPERAAVGQRVSNWTTKAGDDRRWQNSEQAVYDAEISTGFCLTTSQVFTDVCLKRRRKLALVFKPWYCGAVAERCLVRAQRF